MCGENELSQLLIADILFVFPNNKARNRKRYLVVDKIGRRGGVGEMIASLMIGEVKNEAR